jgi:hypothetical protein
MALVNCEIVEDSTVTQVPGEVGITAYELYIKPKEGFYVAARDFVDNTYDTYSSYVQGIINFGSEGKLELTDTIAPYTIGNEVKVTVNLFEDYSISEDTTLSIDIDGEALAIPAIDVNIQLIERFSTLDNGSITIDLEDGVSVVDGGLIGNGWLETFNRHQLTFTGQVGVEGKIATVILKADTNPDIDYVNFVDRINTNSHPDWFYEPGPMSTAGAVGFRWVYESYPDIGGNDTSISTSGGLRVEQKHFVLYYTPEQDFAYDPYSSGAPSSDTDRWNVFNAKVETSEAATRTRSITNVTTDLGSLPSGSFNIIPSSGITASDPLVVKVHGTPGAVFEVEFKEIRVIEGGGVGRSTNTGAVDFFGGIIPNMPVGYITIPRSGLYSFKMPDIASFTTAGRKDFEMKITAGINTIIKPNAIKTGGSSVNIEAINSVVINKFYQYSKVNIEFAADALPSGWAYTHSDYDISSIPEFGGSGFNRTGVPLMPPFTNPKLTSKTHTINFEVRITKTGGAFKLNANNTFSESDFINTLVGNRDIVKFYNLKARIGEGLTDTTVTFATITGSIRCSRFGYQNQTYTIDLSEIFNFA